MIDEGALVTASVDISRRKAAVDHMIRGPRAIARPTKTTALLREEEVLHWISPSTIKALRPPFTIGARTLRATTQRVVATSVRDASMWAETDPSEPTIVAIIVGEVGPGTRCAPIVFFRVYSPRGELHVHK